MVNFDYFNLTTDHQISVIRCSTSLRRTSNTKILFSYSNLNNFRSQLRIYMILNNWLIISLWEFKLENVEYQSIVVCKANMIYKKYFIVINAGTLSTFRYILAKSYTIMNENLNFFDNFYRFLKFVMIGILDIASTPYNEFEMLTNILGKVK